MTEFDTLRAEIETVDFELAKLIEKRMKISSAIGEYKKKNSMPIYDPAREEELKNKNVAFVEKKYQDAYLKIFEKVLQVSKDMQL